MASDFKSFLHCVARPNAGQRTKNRIREHGAGGFKVRDIVEHCDCLNGAAGVLLVASDGWLGWLRAEEIIIDPDNPKTCAASVRTQTD